MLMNSFILNHIAVRIVASSFLYSAKLAIHNTHKKKQQQNRIAEMLTSEYDWMNSA